MKSSRQNITNFDILTHGDFFRFFYGTGVSASKNFVSFFRDFRVFFVLRIFLAMFTAAEYDNSCRLLPMRVL